MYNNTTANANNLYKIEKSSYFTERLNEAQLEEERKEYRLIGMREGIREGMREGERKALFCVAQKLLASGASMELITGLTGLTEDEALQSRG
ncbi:MAG: hypothetical protein LBH66_02085 [Oscillospiraceae bacterium]|jgi:predicted transposase YdaD|nr:hypothetical protein [Oscillospiraceae bacterium]